MEEKIRCQSRSWKVAIVGPTGAAINDFVFKLLYSFPAIEEAGEHGECFSRSGVKLALYSVRFRQAESRAPSSTHFVIGPVLICNPQTESESR